MKEYKNPEMSLCAAISEAQVLTPSPIGVEAAEVKVDEYEDVIGGDAGFGDTELFD